MQHHAPARTLPEAAASPVPDLESRLLASENVLAVLSRRMSFYTGGEKFVVTASRPAGEDAMVASQIIYATNDPPLKIEWRVRVENGNPIIIDVLPEGVSLVLTYRSEFDEVISRNGLDGLLNELRTRAAAKKA